MAIEDFGKKIGGAKKDLWKERGLSIEDLLEFNSAERVKFIKKDNVWKKPDYEKMVADGTPVRVVYFIKLVRDSLPVKPVFSYSDKTEEKINAKQDGFISFIGKMRDAAMGLKTESDVKNFYQKELSSYITNISYSRYVDVSSEAFGCITNKLLKCTQIAEKSFRDIDLGIKEKQFCYSEDDKILAPYHFYLYNKDKMEFTKDYQARDIIKLSSSFGTQYFYPEEKWMNPDEWKDNTYFFTKGATTILGRNFESIDEAKKFILDTFKEKQKEVGVSEALQVTPKKQRKHAFVPKQLAHITREGPEYREGTLVAGQDYLNAFGFRGGEFGNWLNEKDRQASLDFGYEAFLDLSRALHISSDNLSLGGRLSIAFGARGHAGALAHYEPMREVINLTKMKGAGSLAHEWGHALDDIIGKSLGLNGMMSEHLRDTKVPQSFKNLIDSMKYKKVCNEVSKKKQQDYADNYANRIRVYVDRLTPSNSLTDKQKATKKELIDKLILSAGNFSNIEYSKIISGKISCPEIDALSNFKKEICGKVIPKDERIQIGQYLYWLNNYLNDIGKEITIETTFYEHSKKFDKVHSKTDHGYWQSTVEMFARAFACYVKDKLTEKGEHSDYLCGHADTCISNEFDREGNITIIKAFPDGDERKLINEKFDLFFEELKSLNLLDSLDKLPDAKVLSNYKEKCITSSFSLDDKIKKTQDRLKEKSSDNTSLERKETKPTFKETNKGQLEFVFE